MSAPNPDVESETVLSCDLCKGREFSVRARFPEYLRFTGETFTLVECAECGLDFINPRPTRASIGAYYPDDYFAHQGSAPRPLRRWEKLAGQDRSRLGWLRRLALRTLEDVSWYVIPQPRGARRVLDVGAGAGKLLDLMKQLGWTTFGVDPSEGAAERMRGKGHAAIAGSAEDRLFGDERFDVVYMWHALEHVHSPARALAVAREYLAPGGQLVLAVPNFGSLQAGLFGRWWWSTDAPRHLYQLTRATLTRYLEGAGLRVVSMTTRTGSTSWARGVRHVVNGVTGARWEHDPAWMVALCELPVVGGSLVRYFGVGSELRVVCEAA